MAGLRLALRFAALTVVALIAACGGGGGGSGPEPSASTAASTQGSSATSSESAPQDANAPQATGDTATDGFNWFNYRRQQIGLAAVARNSLLNDAAQGHSDYQRLNQIITHEQTPGNPGFTGARLEDRLRTAGYIFNQSSYSYGEVISATGSIAGSSAADELIAAIYHRFVIFQPMFKEAGAGNASAPNGYSYFTTNFAANGLGPGVGRGNVVHYPFTDQQHLPTVFHSDRETPDPVQNRDEVGYPVSIHADITAVVNVQSFSLTPRGGAALPVHLLSRATDPNTPVSVAAIIPVDILAAKTTYDVQFTGTVDGVAVRRTWSFTTR
jgi:uncharacterized protein YkwD